VGRDVERPTLRAGYAALLRRVDRRSSLLHEKAWREWLLFVAGTALAAAVYFFRSFFKKRDVQVEMMRNLVKQEWWASTAAAEVRVARVYVFADGSCQIRHADEASYSFESHARAENRLREDEFAPIPELVSAGRVSRELQKRLERQFIDTLGAERARARCRHPGCRKGAVRFSRFCVHHHFQSVIGRPYED
jgi:hypothetical protein